MNIPCDTSPVITQTKICSSGGCTRCDSDQERGCCRSQWVFPQAFYRSSCARGQARSAKSHRPQDLLQQAGRAPIIGASHIGTLLVAVSRQSVEATHDAFLKNTTQDGEANLTTIESISRREPGRFVAPAELSR
jgi:hypothetical protein